MADAYYTDFGNAMFGNGVHGAVDLDTDDIRCFLYDEAADALNLADQDIADIISGARIASSPDLTSKTVGVVAAGVFDHADEVFAAVTGASIESITYWAYNVTETIAPLIMNIDSATGLPITPNGGSITWTPSASGVVKNI